MKNWVPPVTGDDEADLERSLYEFLIQRLPGLRIVRQYGHDRLRADIVIEERVAIEIKYALASASEYQRLIGQLEDYQSWGIKLVLILAGQTDPDIEHRVRQHLRSRIDSPFPDAALVVKPT